MTKSVPTQHPEMVQTAPAEPAQTIPDRPLQDVAPQPVDESPAPGNPDDKPAKDGQKPKMGAGRPVPVAMRPQQQLGIKPMAYVEPFCKFLTDQPTVFHSVDKVKQMLKNGGFTKLAERDLWKLEKGGKYFVERNGSSLIAFSVGEDYEPGNGVAMVAGHIDALTVKLKPIPKKEVKAGYVQLGVAPYAGALNNTWWDRDLGIAGRVLVRKDDGSIAIKLVKIDEPIARIPTLAPHFGRAAAGPFNLETQMVPIIGLEGDVSEDKRAAKLVKKEAKQAEKAMKKAEKAAQKAAKKAERKEKKQARKEQQRKAGLTEKQIELIASEAELSESDEKTLNEKTELSESDEQSPNEKSDVDVESSGSEKPKQKQKQKHKKKQVQKGAGFVKPHDRASVIGGTTTFTSTQPRRLVEFITSKLGIEDESRIVSWELELFDPQPAQTGGLNKEFIFGGRIDDKLCSWAAIQGLLGSSHNSEVNAKSCSSIIKCVALFDNEEIGSLLRQGARGNFLPSTVERIVDSFASPTAGANLLAKTYANSFLISADVTHAVNPNFLEVYLPQHAPRLNVGVAVSADPNGHMTTDAVSAALLKRVAEKCGSTLQIFQIRNDSRGGGTVGPMLSSAMGVRAVDAGIPQLSMHSIRATTGARDPGLGVKLFKGFFDHFEAVDKEFSRT